MIASLDRSPDTDNDIVLSRRATTPKRLAIAALEPACRVTGVTDPRFLRASHIKPWRDATNEERLDGFNGLMLSPHVDHLFDGRLISFSPHGTLLFSKRLPASVAAKWEIRLRNKPRPLSERQEEYMREHRRHL